MVEIVFFCDFRWVLAHRLGRGWKYFTRNFLEGPWQPINWIRLLWRGWGVHFQAQTGKTTRITDFLWLSVVVSPQIEGCVQAPENIYSDTTLAVRWQSIKWIELLWPGRRSHFPSQAGETVRIVSFLRLLWVLTHGSRGGYGIQKEVWAKLLGWPPRDLLIKWIELLWRGWGSHFLS